jgi:peptide/nickel transport system substrate-binding protein
MCGGRLRFLAIVLLLLSSFIGCQKQESIEPLRLAQTENLYSFDPDRAADAQSRAILSNFYEALVEFDSDLKIQPALATNWNTPDELTWIFELRKGVKFHDGHTLTAADVKASIERVGGPGVYDPVIGISAIDVMDSYHLRLRLAHPAPLLLNRLTQILIVSANQAVISIEQPIGTGPYRFIRRTKTEIDLEAFDRHWRGKPSIKSIRFSPLSAKAITDDFAKRKLDVYRLLPASLQKGSQPGFHVLGRSGLAVMYLWFNCNAVIEGRKNPFGDVRVRQAISLALNRNRIVENLGGRDTAADQLIPDGVFGFMPSWPEVKYDPENSRKLLREAGYPNGFQSAFAHPPGEEYERLTTAIAEMLAPIGIRVQAKELDFVKFLEARRNQQLPFFALTWTFDDGDAWTFFMASLHSKAGPEDFRSTNPGYSNVDVDRLIQESQQATGIYDIPTHYEAILKLVMSEFPIIPLYRRYDLYGVSERVRFRPRLDGKLLAAEMQMKEEP